MYKGKSVAVYEYRPVPGLAVLGSNLDAHEYQVIDWPFEHSMVRSLVRILEHAFASGYVSRRERIQYVSDRLTHINS